MKHGGHRQRKGAYVSWVRTLPCAICELTGTQQIYPTETDHHPTIGAAGKRHTKVWPLCTKHHNERHSMGIETFESRYGVKIEDRVRELRETYEVTK